MALPVVAIVGRPNVGKSTLFNRLVGRRKAVVEDIPGVTRDRLYEEVEWEGRRFILVDTGGLYPEAEEEPLRQVKDQAMYAIQEADLVICLFDGRDGLTEVDRQIVRLLREADKPVLYVVNKMDTKKAQEHFYEFYELGIKDLYGLSASTGRGVEEVVEEVLRHLPQSQVSDRDEKELPKIAVVGRPNVGKSTLMNALLGRQRMIVSSAPGTTRDAVDCICKYYGKEYLFVDTPGVRRRSRIEETLERYMVVRALRSIERADVVVLVMDSLEGVTEQDQKLAALTERYGKGLVLVFTKWDLVEEPERRYAQIQADVSRKLHFVSYAPFLTVSGLTRKRATKVFPLIDMVLRERSKRIPTSQLNRVQTEVNPYLPTFRGKETKILYITQTGICPPEFVLFVNNPEAFTRPVLKYIERKIRERFEFKGTPLRFLVRQRV